MKVLLCHTVVTSSLMDCIVFCYYSSLSTQDNDKQTQQQINMSRGIREPIIEHHNRYTALSES